MSGEFERDKRDMLGPRETFLRPFYQRHMSSFEFVDRDIDVIAVGRATGKTYRIEEKIIRPPRVLANFSNYLLETWSCTNPGWERPGWMETNPADLLFYGFCSANGQTMDLHILDMPALKAWFWPLRDLFETHVTDQINHTEVCKVPFGIVPPAIRLHRTLLLAPGAADEGGF